MENLFLTFYEACWPRELVETLSHHAFFYFSPSRYYALSPGTYIWLWRAGAYSDLINNKPHYLSRSLCILVSLRTLAILSHICFEERHSKKRWAMFSIRLLAKYIWSIHIYIPVHHATPCWQPISHRSWVIEPNPLVPFLDLMLLSYNLSSFTGRGHTSIKRCLLLPAASFLWTSQSPILLCLESEFCDSSFCGICIRQPCINRYPHINMYPLLSDQEETILRSSYHSLLYFCKTPLLFLYTLESSSKLIFKPDILSNSANTFSTPPTDLIHAIIELLYVFMLWSWFCPKTCYN